MTLPVMIRTRRPQHSTVQTPIESYLREINETPLLKAEEEKQLAYRIEDGDNEARDHLVRANLRLVVNIARSYQGKGLALQDLIAEGNLGLLRAVEGYDPSMNTRFSTYASFWIKQSMKRAVVNTAKTVRLPAYMVQLLTEWRRAAARLHEELGRTATEDEIANRLKLPKKKLNIIKKAIRIYNAGPQGEVEDTGWSIDDLAMDNLSHTPDAQMMHSDDLHQVLHLLDSLEDREATVLRLRFGLNGQEPMTLKEIGGCLDLTRERVRQIEREALGKLHEMLENE
jgi:RNA polymerase primary sigma factor